jgi:ankyrin repeat protein
MKNGDLTVFSDIITEITDLEIGQSGILPKGHWINQHLKESDDKTLLLTSIDMNCHEYTSILLRVGADPSLYNIDLKVTPLIFAVKKRNFKAMKLLLQFKAEVNSVSGNSGQTALHVAADLGFTEGVTLLLNQPGIEVNLKDKKGRGTPLFLALKASDEESVRLLIAHGSDLDLKDIRSRINSKFPHLDPDSIPKVICLFLNIEFFKKNIYFWLKSWYFVQILLY